ncbi:MAG TPA: hypothetical protein VFS94_08980 [Gemmatimonadales bacterium]|nr:hypothetical protein [Gemmatimonadales bacterium]
MPWLTVAAVFLLAVTSPCSLRAQAFVELGGQALVLARDPAVFAGGVHAAVRTTPRTRFMATLSGGSLDGEALGRAEGLGHFLLNPLDPSGVGLYGGGGLGWEFLEGSRGYVVLLLGLEGNPGGRSGWFLEGGWGGGARISAGWRWRFRPEGWPRRR